MGIPGLMKEIGKGDRIALAKLALDHFDKHKRPLRIAIDAAIWNFQTQYGGAGGKNPALRTLYFRLLRLLALPIHPVFVYDGKNKPLTKRGKTVNRYGSSVPAELSKNLVARFQFPYHVAPGEAEAECAFLQRHGVVDAVMTQDVDAIMFGSGMTLRNWSKEGTKGNKAPSHVDVLDIVRIKAQSGLDTKGMILVALLNGGDYHDGVPGFGPGLSCEVARAGFGEELMNTVIAGDRHGLVEWRERLQYELESNESGYFAKRHKTVKIPQDFPDQTILDYYLNPAISQVGDLSKLERRWLSWWTKDIDIPALRQYVAMTFDWLYRKGATYFIRSLAQPLFQHRLKTRKIMESDFSIGGIGDNRKHFSMDGAPEVRMTVNPLKTVGIDMAAEDDDPEFAELLDDGEELEVDADHQISKRMSDEPVNSAQRKQRLPWDPAVSERWWVPEAMLRHGLPELMGKRDRALAEIENDPKKFAVRNIKPATKSAPKSHKAIDSGMKIGSMHNFIPGVKSTSAASSQPESKLVTNNRISKSTREPLARSKSNPLTSLPSEKHSIQQFFKPRKQGVRRDGQVLDPVSEYDQAISVEKGSILKIMDDCLEDLDLPEMKDLYKSKTRTKLGRCSTLPTNLSIPDQSASLSRLEIERDIEADFLEDSLHTNTGQIHLQSTQKAVGRPFDGTVLIRGYETTESGLGLPNPKRDAQSKSSLERSLNTIPFTPQKPLRDVIDLTMS